MSRFLGLGTGSDGSVDLSSYTQLKYSCSGSSGSSSLSATGTFSAGDRLFIHQTRGSGAGNYEDNRVASYSTGTVTLVHPLENTYSDSGASQAQVLVVKEASGVTGSLTIPAWDGNTGGLFVMACSGTFSGDVNGNAKGFRGSQGTTDSWGGDPKNAPLNYGYYAEGTAGASGTRSNNSANGNGAGASSNGTDVLHQCGGSGGSHASGATEGEEYTSNGSSGSIGSTVGSASLETVFFGGGGAGCRIHQSESYKLGDGGNGGGIIIIYTNKLSSDSSLTVNGENGESPTGSDTAAGGGGAGGSILIKSVSASLGTITATGGSKGTGTRVDGGNGGNGRIRVEACNLSGTTSPAASTSTGGHSYCGLMGGMV